MIYSHFRGVYFDIQNGSWIRRPLGKSKKSPESEQTFQKLIAAKWAVLAPIFFNDKKVHEYTFQMSPFGMIYSHFKGVYFEIQNGSWIRRLFRKVACSISPCSVLPRFVRTNFLSSFYLHLLQVSSSAMCSNLSPFLTLSPLHCRPAYSSPLCAHTALSLLHYSTELALQCVKELRAS